MSLKYEPLSSEYGTYKTVKARFWHWLRPESGLDFQAKVRETFSVNLSSLESGQGMSEGL